jgi:Flp pilus assembly protein TadG
MLDHRALRRHTGQMMLEMALVLPILVLILSAVIDFVRIWNAQETLHRMTRSAVTWGTQVKADGTRPTTAEVSDQLLASVLPPLTRGQVSVELVNVGLRDASGGDSVAVRASTRVGFLTPIIGRFFHSDALRVESSAQLPFMQYAPGTAVQVPPPPFQIDDDGEIDITANTGATITVLGKQLNYGPGGPPMRVTLKFADRGSNFAPIFGGQAVTGGESFYVSGLDKDDELAFEARATHTSGAQTVFDRTYRSNHQDRFSDDPRNQDGSPKAHHVTVLKDGDRLPEWSAFAGQTQLAEYLEPYVDQQSKTLRMTPGEAIVLWEFNSVYNSPASDFQDLVVHLKFD